MVLHRRNLPLLSQEEIGKELGLNVPVEDVRLLPHAYTDDPPKSGWGTRIDLEEYSLNRFFERRDYPLRERYLDPEHFPDKPTVWLSNQLAADNDVLVSFDYQMAWGREMSFGHSSLVEAVDDDAATLVDPAYAAPKLRDISPERLLTAMWARGIENRGGFSVIENSP